MEKLKCCLCLGEVGNITFEVKSVSKVRADIIVALYTDSNEIRSKATSDARNPDDKGMCCLTCYIEYVLPLLHRGAISPRARAWVLVNLAQLLQAHDSDKETKKKYSERTYPNQSYGALTSAQGFVEQNLDFWGDHIVPISKPIDGQRHFGK